MKIKVIEPIIDLSEVEVLQDLQPFVNPGTELSVEKIAFGPASIESEYDVSIAVPYILEKVQKAEGDGFQGIFIDCFGDPGVRAARELVDIPVFGAFQPSMFLGAALGQRMTIITVLQGLVPILRNQVSENGLSEKVVSIRPVNIPVLELNDKRRSEEAILEQCLRAIREDDPHVFILGCTGMVGIASSVQKRLLKEGFDVPVIDPAFAALKMLETCIAMDLKQSRLTYFKPPEKTRITNR